MELIVQNTARIHSSQQIEQIISDGSQQHQHIRCMSGSDDELAKSLYKLNYIFTSCFFTFCTFPPPVAADQSDQRQSDLWSLRWTASCSAAISRRISLHWLKYKTSQMIHKRQYLHQHQLVRLRQETLFRAISRFLPSFYEQKDAQKDKRQSDQWKSWQDELHKYGIYVLLQQPGFTDTSL